jgi:hypothetical protein
MSLKPKGAAGCVWIFVAVHLVWGIGRVPGRVWGQRLDDITDYRGDGVVRYFFGSESERRGSVDAVTWLLQHSPPESAVLWRGESKRMFELASGLLAPRWLVDANHVPANVREFLGRPIAAGDAGVAVLVGNGESVALEFR